MEILFNRKEAGKLLSEKLLKYSDTETIVLAIPKGGVPVGYEIATKLDVPLGITLIKKIGHPSNKEYAIGAVSLDSFYIDNSMDIDKKYIESEVKRIQDLLHQKQKLYEGNKQPLQLKNKTVIIVDDGKWISPVVLKGKINGVYHEGPATFNKSQDVVYFTRSNYSSKRRLQRDADNISNLKIFEASMINGNWEKLQGMPFNSDDYSCGHPTLSEDGKTLYFISDMPGGYGGTDVYKTNKTADGKWSAPINLGEVVNTPGNEMFPYIHGNDTLYFASEAHHSLGGLDVFMTYHASEDWHEPVNLNYPLNSSKDDFGFYLNNEDHRSGYVSSNRENMHDAVYTFHINDPTLTLKGVVTVKGTGEIIKNARIQVEVPVDKTTADLFTDENGRYFTPLTIEKEYKLMASKQNFLSMSDHVSTKNQKISKEYIRDFELEALVIQKPIIIPNIYYDFDKWNIRPDAAIELDKMVTLLNDNPKIRIEMGSHTDCRGTHKYNDVLSMKRARSTVEYLISKGIEKKRLEYKGYGETKLLNDCGCEPDNVGPGKDCTSEQHQQNRRTEFKVIEVMK